MQSLDKLNAVQEVVTFTVPGSALAAGQNQLVAVYAGDANYLGSTAAATVTDPSNGMNGPGFTLTGPPAGVTVPSLGGAANGTIVVAPRNGFTGTVSLNCTLVATNPSNSARLPTCNITPSVALAAYTSENATLTIQTDAPTAALARSTPLPPNLLTRGLFGSTIGSVLCSLLLLVSPVRRRGSLLFSIATLGIFAVTGCGVHVTPRANIPQTGTYTATITGTSAGITESTQVLVQVP